LNIALFGGTFDPIHTGHLRAAEAAARKYRLDRILFVPSGNPPHKVGNHLTSFEHRFVMVSLVCAGNRRFVPSLLEVPTPAARPHYTIATVRKVRRSLGKKDQLFFLIGLDAFLDLPSWKGYRQLLDLVHFIVVSRPGYSNSEIAKVVPAGMICKNPNGPRRDTITLRRTRIHILRGVDLPVASRDIRQAIESGRPVTGLVPPLVEEYLKKEDIYRRKH
jgi:nicotinate-nucleotide adenylyltransferase